MGDGHFNKIHKTIEFATHSFSLQDVKILHEAIEFFRYK
jgi:hypothetical protein